MSRTTPQWWYGNTGFVPALLAPAAFAWNVATLLRWKLGRAYRSKLPVICIGNLTAGGAGKTPAAMAVARMLQQDGVKPLFLTRGYGGTKKIPHIVDPNLDSAGDVGDEALLLARVAPTIVAANRAKGARLAEGMNVHVIIMDDGFQNPSLAKDYALLVIDKAKGVGNGRVMPAGPLRAKVEAQLARAQAIVAVGSGNAADRIVGEAKALGLPIFDAEIVPKDKTGWLTQKPLVAFAGIGNPGKFFETIESLGGHLEHRIEYPDHYTYTRSDAERLLKLAADARAELVTTEKDLVRLVGRDRLEALKRSVRPLPVRLRFKDQGRLKRTLMRALRRR